jgi:hypothetical protein
MARRLHPIRQGSASAAGHLSHTLLIGAVTDLMPSSWRNPAEQSEAGLFAPARVHAPAAESTAAQSERFGCPGPGRQEQVQPDESGERSEHVPDRRTIRARLIYPALADGRRLPGLIARSRSACPNRDPLRHAGRRIISPSASKENGHYARVRWTLTGTREGCRTPSLRWAVSRRLWESRREMERSVRPPSCRR